MPVSTNHEFVRSSPEVWRCQLEANDAVLYPEHALPLSSIVSKMYHGLTGVDTALFAYEPYHIHIGLVMRFLGLAAVFVRPDH